MSRANTSDKDEETTTSDCHDKSDGALVKVKPQSFAGPILVQLLSDVSSRRSLKQLESAHPEEGNSRRHRVEVQPREPVGLCMEIHARAMPTSLPVILGSSSGLRRRIMEQLGWQFSTASPDINEKAIRHPDAREMCSMIARAKADALMGRVSPPGILITADQVCVFDGGDGEVVREKPVDDEEARNFLESYSNRSVRTVSALCVVNMETGFKVDGRHESVVYWREIPQEVVDSVVREGHAMGSAGGFALEVPSLRNLVEDIDGSIDSVYGLPINLMCDLIAQAASSAVV